MRDSLVYSPWWKNTENLCCEAMCVLVCVDTETGTQREPFPVLLSRQWDLAENRGANIICRLQQSMLKYKHGRGRYALNAQTQRQKRKNNTSYNRLQKIISILSVCLTIEAILCVYGRRGKTDWLTGRRTGSWLQHQANPQLFATKKKRKSVQFLTNKRTILFILILHSLALTLCLSLPFPPHNAYLWACSSLTQQCSWVISHIKQIPSL